MNYIPILPICRAYMKAIDLTPTPIAKRGFSHVLEDQILFVQAHPNAVCKLQRGVTCHPEIAFFYDWFRANIDYISAKGFQNIDEFDLFKECFIPIQNIICNADRYLAISMQKEYELIAPRLNALSYVRGFLLYFPIRNTSRLLFAPVVSNPQIPENKCFLKNEHLQK